MMYMGTEEPCLLLATPSTVDDSWNVECWAVENGMENNLVRLALTVLMASEPPTVMFQVSPEDCDFSNLPLSVTDVVVTRMTLFVEAKKRLKEVHRENLAV